MPSEQLVQTTAPIDEWGAVIWEHVPAHAAAFGTVTYVPPAPLFVRCRGRRRVLFLIEMTDWLC